MANRFIPTHVGLISAPMALAPATAVHPHTCGANAMAKLWQGNGNGSSPHMWG